MGSRLLESQAFQEVWPPLFTPWGNFSPWKKKSHEDERESSLTFFVPASGWSRFTAQSPIRNWVAFEFQRGILAFVSTTKSQEKRTPLKIHFTKTGSSSWTRHFSDTIDYIGLLADTIFVCEDIFLPKSSVESSLWWDLNELLQVLEKAIIPEIIAKAITGASPHSPSWMKAHIRRTAGHLMTAM